MLFENRFFCLLAAVVVMLPGSVAASVSAPALSIPSGSYAARFETVISHEDSRAVIHFTTTGQDPVETDPVIKSGRSILIDRGGVLKARAFVPNESPGALASANYALTGAVAGGDDFTLALSTSGQVSGWGYNAYGQLGDGSTVLRNSPVAMSGLSDVVAIAAGISHSYALKSDGTVWASGYNAMGQLGDGTTTNRSTPTKVQGLGNVVAIAAGSHSGMAVKRDGSVWAWGRNASGELGDGTTIQRLIPVQVLGLSGIQQVAVGESHSIAIKEDGTAWTWGYNAQGQLGDGTAVTRHTPVQVPGIAGAKQVSAGTYFSHVLLSDGTVKGWGANGNGELGDGTNTYRNTPVAVAQLTGVASISSGSYHVIAVKSDGTARSWGYNYQGNLGDGTYTYRNSPVVMTTGGTIVGSAGGYSHSALLKSDGTVHTVGLNSHGQLGKGTSGGYQFTFAQVVNTQLVVAGAPSTPRRLNALTGNAQVELSWVGSNSAVTYTVKRSSAPGGPYTPVQSGVSSPESLDGTISNGVAGYYVVTGTNPSGESSPSAEISAMPLAPPGAPQAFAARSGNSRIYLSWDAVAGATRYTLKRSTSAGGPYEVVATVMNQLSHVDSGLSNGSTRFYILTAANTPLSEGQPSQEASATPQSGISQTATPQLLPADWSHPLRQILSVSCSDPGAIIRFTTDGRDPVETDPAIDSGETMLFERSGTLKARAFKVGELPSEICVVSHAVTGDVSAGEYHSVGLNSDGRVQTWGYNYDGQIGDNTYTNRASPIEVTSLKNVVGVAASAFDTFAVKQDGSVWGWGKNANYQLGDGTTTGRAVPVKVLNINKVKSVSAGMYHTIALRTDGTVWTWGYNAQGQLGDGTWTDRKYPVQVIGLTGVVQIAAGDYFSMALKSDGTVVAWGQNNNGQLGDGTTTARWSPVLVSGLAGVIQIAAEKYSGLALMANQTVKGWGANGNGELGDGTTQHRSVPVTVSYLSDVTWIGRGGYHGLAVKADGTASAWGLNSYGQLADGTLTVRSIPVRAGIVAKAVRASGGLYHSSILCADGSIWSAGYDAQGQLCRGTTGPYQMALVKAAGLSLTPGSQPSSPTSLAALAGDGTIKLTWAGNTGATSYSVKRSNVPGGPYTLIQSNLAARTFLDGSLNNGTTYYYVVTASNSSGESASSPEAVATPQAPPPAPTSLQVTLAADRAFLAWNAVAGATSYTVLRSTSSTGAYEVVASQIVGSTFTDTALEPGVAYHYKIASANTPLAYGAAGSAVSQNTVVGSTAGSFGVDESGAATYSIPITVPAGTGGMEPKLALTYGSSGGNGPLGVGWTLGGLSVITRGGTSLAQDGFVDGVDFDDNDRFYLDGERLVAISGAYGADGTEYRTENTNFSKIISRNNFNGGPLWFEVWTKSGLRMELGCSDNSEICDTNFSRIIAWGVNKIEDSVGNSMWIHYEKDIWSDGGTTRGEYNPSHIFYTYNYNAGLTAYNSVKFVYEDRPDVTEGYVRGTLVKTRKRLSAVHARHGETVVREYRLSYDISPRTGRSRIVAVQEFGLDGKPFPALTFNWSKTDEGWHQANQWTPPVALADSTGDLNRQWIDVNGDGLIDVIWHRIKSGGTVDKGAFLNTGSGYVSDASYVPPLPLAHDSYSDYGTRMADLNGDGLVDLLCKATYAPGGGGAWLNTSSGWQPSATFASPIPTAISGWADAGVRLLDVNGDGRADLIYKGSASQFGAYINTGSGWQSTTAWVPPIVLASLSEIFEDLNGDGLVDILYSKGSLQGAWLNTGSGWVTSPEYKLTSVFFASNSIPDLGTRLIDVNGDGLPDVIHSRVSGLNTTSEAYINTGTGWLQVTNANIAAGLVHEWRPPTPLASNSVSDFGRRLADVNGDGLVDLLFSRIAVGQVEEGAWLNTGKGWVADNRWTPPVRFAFDGLDDAGCDLFDANGDGMLDVVNYASGSAAGSSGAYVHNATDAEEIVGLTDGLGASVVVEYKAMSDKSLNAGTGKLTYTKGSGASYPTVDISSGDRVVVSAGTDNGLGGRNWTHYAYGQMRADQQGRGNLGFGWMETVDGDTGTRSTVTYRQDFPFEGLVNTAETRLSNSTLIASSTSAWALKTYDGIGTSKYYFPYLQASTVSNFEINGTAISSATTDSNTYDDFGNLLTSRVDSGGGYIKTTTSTYTNNASTWKLGRLQSSQVLHQAPGVPSILRQSGFGYQTGTGLLNAETAEPGSSSAATTSYGYDAFGNIQTTTLSGADIVSRSSSTTFDARGRFATSATNAVGHTGSTVMNELLGVPTSSTDANGHTTTFQYDGFGRPTSQQSPDGTIATTSLHWAGDGAPENAVYGVTAQTVGLPAATIWHDRLGRPISKETIGDGGRLVYEDTAYDEQGRSYAVSDNYFVGDSPLWSITEYDILDRAIRHTGPDGSVTQSTYNGLSSTVINAKNQSSTTTSNAIGQTVTSTDSMGGAVSYAYDAVGNLLSTTAPGNATTSFTYDSMGRKTSMSDSDSGVWQYFYFSTGELKKQIDAKLQETTFTYDPLGRTLTKTEPEGTTTYTYDTRPSGIGLPATVAHSASGIVDTFEYDSLSRPSGSTRALGSGLSYSFGTAYDGFSRPTIISYPGGFSTTNHYDGQGFLRTVTGDTGTSTPTYWQAMEIDAEGRITEEWLGNGLTTTNTYDRATGFLRAIQTSQSGLAPVQNDTFDYDPLGNLTKRTDVRASLSENFGYDNLNRLTWSQAQSQALKAYTYGANGNITSKTGVGTYSYGASGAGPHAVTGIAGPRAATYTYDANGNMTGGGGRSLQYVSHNKPSLISDSGTGTTISFTYGPSEERVLQVACDLQKSSVTRYIGSLYEIVQNYDSQYGYVSGTPTSTEQRYYIGGPSGTIGVYTKSTPANGPPLATTRYLLTDHLGSTEAITDELGQVTERFSYDAFGAKRNATTWADFAIGALPPTSAITPRGFTGHEMLEAVGLIHMGGRAYDPIIGRFLSADPFVQAPSFTQSYNRYSYVLNNPLSLTDPTGYSWLSKVFKKIHKLHKKVFNHGLKRLKKAAKWVKKNWRTVVVAVAVVVVAVAPYTAPAVFGFATASTWGAVAYGAIGGAVLGGTQAAVYGGTPADILKGALIGAVAGALTAGIGHGIPWSESATGLAKYGEWAAKAALHGINQGGRSMAEGGDFLSGLAGGALGSLVGSTELGAEIGGPTGILIRTTAAAITGGTAAAISGGDFANGAISAAFVHLFNGEVGSYIRRSSFQSWKNAFLAGIRTRLSDLAQGYEGSTSWVKYSWRDGSYGDFKCNIAVYDWANEAGAAVPWIDGSNGWHIPRAGDWANPRTAISGWKVIDSADVQPGDVLATRHVVRWPSRWGGASGHVGVVAGEKLTASSSSRAQPNGKIVVNRWGFQGEGVTARRYFGQ